MAIKNVSFFSKVDKKKAVAAKVAALKKKKEKAAEAKKLYNEKVKTAQGEAMTLLMQARLFSVPQSADKLADWSKLSHDELLGQFLLRRIEGSHIDKELENWQVAREDWEDDPTGEPPVAAASCIPALFALAVSELRARLNGTGQSMFTFNITEAP